MVKTAGAAHELIFFDAAVHDEQRAAFRNVGDESQKVFSSDLGSLPRPDLDTDDNDGQERDRVHDLIDPTIGFL